ncbi:MAG: hypothetical protein PHG65_11680 [Kiritimatiellae bacterium]|nr:hypothetical protein [Kiritimatiellia bacterium]
MHNYNKLLKVSAIIHCVLGGLITGFYLFAGFLLTLYGLGMGSFQQNTFAQNVGLMAVCSLFLVLPVLVLLTGVFLLTHKHYYFCFVILAMECLSFPLGTLLGVLTIVTLLKP